MDWGAQWGGWLGGLGVGFDGRWRLARRGARRARCWRWFAGPSPAQAIQGGMVRLMLGVVGVRRALVL